MIVPLVLLCAACFGCGLIFGVIAMSVATAETQHERGHDAESAAATAERIAKAIEAGADRSAAWTGSVVESGPRQAALLEAAHIARSVTLSRPGHDD